MESRAVWSASPQYAELVQPASGVPLPRQPDLVEAAQAELVEHVHGRLEEMTADDRMVFPRRGKVHVNRGVRGHREAPVQGDELRGREEGPPKVVPAGEAPQLLL